MQNIMSILRLFFNLTSDVFFNLSLCEAFLRRYFEQQDSVP